MPIPAEEFTPDPKFTSSFLLENCTFKSEGRNPYFILKPGYRIVLESEEEKARITVLDETRVVTRKYGGRRSHHESSGRTGVGERRR